MPNRFFSPRARRSKWSSPTTTRQTIFTIRTNRRSASGTACNPPMKWANCGSRFSPGTPMTWRRFRYRQQNKPVEARSEFENALLLNPNNYKAHGNPGVVLAEQGDAESAEAHFRTALRINPDDSLAQECLDELLKAKPRLPGKK